MEPLQKRQRLSGYPNADVELRRKRAQNDKRLKSIFESIFEKYEKDFNGIGDEINLETGKIEVDNGHIFGMRHEKDAGNKDEESASATASSDTSSADKISDSTKESSGENHHEGFDQSAEEGIEASRLRKEERFLLNREKRRSNAFDPNHTEPRQLVDDYDDELAFDGHKPSTPRMGTARKKNPWQLPDQVNSVEEQTGCDAVWSAPSYLRGLTFPKERPFHRRLALPSSHKLDIRGIEAHAFANKSSIWAVEPLHRRRSRITNEGIRESSRSKCHFDPACRAESWTAREQDELRYMKTLTTLTFRDLIKYFPGHTEQSLEDCWDEVKVHGNVQAILKSGSQSKHLSNSPLSTSAEGSEAGADPISQCGSSHHLLFNGRYSPPALNLHRTPERPTPACFLEVHKPTSSHTYNSHLTVSDGMRQLHGPNGRSLMDHCQPDGDSDSAPHLATEASREGLRKDCVSREIPDSDSLMESFSSRSDLETTSPSILDARWTPQNPKAGSDLKITCISEQMTAFDTRNDLENLRLNESVSTREPKFVDYGQAQPTITPNSHHSLYQLAVPTSHSRPRMKLYKESPTSKFPRRRSKSRPREQKAYDKLLTSGHGRARNNSFSSGHSRFTTHTSTPADIQIEMKEGDLSLEVEGVFAAQMADSSIYNGSPRTTSREIADSQPSQRIMIASRRNTQTADENSSLQGVIDNVGPQQLSKKSSEDHQMHIHANTLPPRKGSSSKKTTASALPSNVQVSVIRSPISKQAALVKQTHSALRTKKARNTSEFSLSELCDGSDDDLSICLADALPIRTPQRLMPKPSTRHTYSSGMDDDGSSICLTSSKPNSNRKHVAPKPKISMELPTHIADYSDDELA